MSRTRYRFNNTRSNNIVVRTPYGIGTKTPEMHADSIEGLFSQLPGYVWLCLQIQRMLKVCYSHQLKIMTLLFSLKTSTFTVH